MIFEVLAENIIPATLCDENWQLSHCFDIDILFSQIRMIFYQLWQMENVLREEHFFSFNQKTAATSVFLVAI